MDEPRSTALSPISAGKGARIAAVIREHEPWGDNTGDVHCKAHGFQSDYVAHLTAALADAVDLMRADEETRRWLQALTARLTHRATQVKEREGTGGQLGAYWTGYAIALQDVEHAALLDWFAARAAREQSQEGDAS